MDCSALLLIWVYFILLIVALVDLASSLVTDGVVDEVQLDQGLDDGEADHRRFVCRLRIVAR